jgi:peptidoglycan/LPS O-acetylase OafA/YrhL
MPYYLTYTYNLKINFRYLLHLTESSNQFFGHLWSLAVEEQFYLIFPLIVYFASIKNLKRIVISLLIICPLIRLWAAIYGIHIFSDKYWLGEFIYSNTFCQSDALVTGAVLAIFNFKLKKPYLFFFIIGIIWLTIGIINLYFLRQAGYFLVEGKSLGYNFPGFWFMHPTSHFLINIRPFYLYTLVNLLAVSLILPAIVGAPLFSRFFSSGFMDYLGKISYGIYVYHNPLIAVLLILLSSFGLTSLFHQNILFQVMCFISYFIILITISHLSFQYFEKKFLKLKHPDLIKPI